MSIIQSAIDYLWLSSPEYISNTELIHVVSNITGCSNQSVKGTLFKRDTKGTGLYTVESQLKTGYKPFNNGFIKLKENEPPVITRDDYDCPIKDSIRQKILSYINIKNPIILTFAAHQGLCVKQMIDKFPDATIINIERCKYIFNEYKKLNLPTIDYNNDASEVLPELLKNNIDLFNYDSCSYFSKNHHENLSLINDKSSINTLAITLYNAKNLMNTGTWVDRMKLLYNHLDDPIKNIIIDTLSKYELKDEIMYRKSNVVRARAMRVFIFTKKANE